MVSATHTRCFTTIATHRATEELIESYQTLQKRSEDGSTHATDEVEFDT